MADEFHISNEEAGELRKAVRQAMTLLEYVGDRLGQTAAKELRSDYPTDEFGARPIISVRGLRNKIKEELRNAARPLRSVDIADALYHKSMGVSRDRFMRKVIVSVSLMYKEGGHGIKKIAIDGRDALWAYDNAEPVGTMVTQAMRTSFDIPEQQTITAPSRATQAP